MSSIVFCLVCVYELLLIIYRNNLLHGYAPKASIMHHGDLISISIEVRRRIDVIPGQYINLWTPSISFWSALQSHPFMVMASHRQDNTTTLDILVHSRKGLTSKLAQYAQGESKFSSLMFTGPHGVPAPVAKYHKVMIVASGVGIVAQLPYLTQLTQRYSTSNWHLRDVHLIWQVEDRGQFAPSCAARFR